MFTYPSYSWVLAQKLTIPLFYSEMARNVLYHIDTIAQDEMILSSTLVLFMSLFPFIAIFPMMPQFIISIWELYDHDLHCHWQGIDTGFGVLSQPTSSQDAAVSVIALVGISPGQAHVVGGDMNESEAVWMEKVMSTAAFRIHTALETSFIRKNLPPPEPIQIHVDLFISPISILAS